MSDSFLIIQSGFLGDAVLASGMLRALYAARPDADVGIVVREGFAELFAGHPAVTMLHPFSKKSTEGTKRLIGELRERKYSCALLPHRSFRTAWIARRADIPCRIGFRQSDAPWLLTDRVEYHIAEHETMRNAQLLRQAGIIVERTDVLPWLVPHPGEVERMKQQVGGGESVVVIAPGSVWPTKRWTVEGYADIARDLTDAGRCVVLAGSSTERSICKEIAARASSSNLIVTAGDLALTELLALIACADRVFTNDSAPLHLAESVGTPVTAIFGPTVPEFGFGPQRERSVAVGLDGLACRPCRIHGSRRCPIGTHECMTRISAADVMATMER